MTDKRNAHLLSIIAHARSGALDHAWRLFIQAGLDQVRDDPSVLSVRGRLLKGRAREADAGDRARLYLEAAEAYHQASRQNGATYPLINAATLSLLAGDPRASADLARQTLERLDSGPNDGETPYYNAATRSEALLLLGRTGEARIVLTAAVHCAPRAWEDHASTVRQFELILSTQGEDPAWLDALRPPASLHFAGRIDIGPDPAEIVGQIRAVLTQNRIGFAYGALAAGSDILIAEAVLEHGAELHLLLPAAPDAFRERSVAPSGGDWAPRFDAVLARADTVRTVGLGDPGCAAIRLAAEAAMGAAVMQARLLAAEAVQLLILDARPTDDPRSCDASRWSGDIWTGAGRRQLVIDAPDASRQKTRKQGAAGDGIVAAVVAVALPAGGVADDQRTSLAAALASIATAVAGGPAPLAAPRWSSEVLTVAFPTPVEAAAALAAISRSTDQGAGLSAGAHYGTVEGQDDPFGGPPAFVGAAADLALAILRSAPPGATLVSEDFAAALNARLAEAPRTEHVGELGGRKPDQALKLYSLRP